MRFPPLTNRLAERWSGDRKRVGRGDAEHRTEEKKGGATLGGNEGDSPGECVLEISFRGVTGQSGHPCL